jgi:hypothetical protein
MSNWELINRGRVRTGMFASDDNLGFNGAFCLWICGARVKVIASDGEGWQHVSVSLQDHPTTPPKWDLMCEVKRLFWEPEDCVVQFHPPESEYVNNHAGCLHLWRCIDGRQQPLPPSILVGILTKPPKPK